MLKNAKRSLTNRLLKYLFNAVTEDDILKVQNGNFIINGKVLDQMSKDDITSGADAIKRMVTWQLLIKDLKWTANDAIFNKSKTEADLIFPKAILFTLDLMEKKLENLSKLKWTTTTTPIAQVAHQSAVQTILSSFTN